VTPLSQILLVGTGGFIGSALRYIVSSSLHVALPSVQFPHGTLAVNVLGCLAIGFLGGLGDAHHPLAHAQRLFLITGVLGGFTTFSAFGYETLALAQGGEVIKAIANVLLEVGFGLGAAWLGYGAARFV
jgi:CrcB protein